MTRPIHISLFSGVGMTDLAVESLGYETVVTAETDPFCRRVLSKRFPRAIHMPSVQAVTAAAFPGFTAGGPGRAWRGSRSPLLISGGFPCQNVSGLGRGEGVGTGDRSGLWREFARVIGEFRPDAVLIENSPMLRSRGLDKVLWDLFELGYVAQWDGIPAASVGAPHLRDRIFIVAIPATATGVFQGIVGSPYPRAGRLDATGRTCELTPRATYKVARAKHAFLFPTPRAAANEWRTTKNAPTHGTTHGATLAGTLNDMERAAGRVPAPSSESAGNINPNWVEWLLGLPGGWTDPTLVNPAPHAGWSTEPYIPRTLANAYERKNRLSALGNGLVPQAAAAALEMLQELNGAIPCPLD